MAIKWFLVSQLKCMYVSRKGLQLITLEKKLNFESKAFRKYAKEQGLKNCFFGKENTGSAKEFCDGSTRLSQTMKDMKQIFLLGLVVGMILGAIIILFSFFVGNFSLGFNKIWAQSDYAPYFKAKANGLFYNSKNENPYRIKKIVRDGTDYVYILEGMKNKPQEKQEMHPNRKPTKIAPL